MTNDTQFDPDSSMRAALARLLTLLATAWGGCIGAGAGPTWVDHEPRAPHTVEVRMPPRLSSTRTEAEAGVGAGAASATHARTRVAHGVWPPCCPAEPLQPAEHGADDVAMRMLMCARTATSHTDATGLQVRGASTTKTLRCFSTLSAAGAGGKVC
jgi:hypothetical protein